MRVVCVYEGDWFDCKKQMVDNDRKLPKYMSEYTVTGWEEEDGYRYYNLAEITTDLFDAKAFFIISSGVDGVEVLKSEGTKIESKELV